jgi:hypothetical protein
VLKPCLFIACLLIFLLAPTACATRPTLDEQKVFIRNGQLRLHVLGSRAFLDTWGKPAYAQRERMQFFPVEGGNYVPRFRMPMGEPPSGWTSTVVSEESVFFAYPDHGVLLGFIDDRLVYREHLPAEQVHAVGKMWERESLFKTRLEKEIPNSSKP